MTSSLEIRPLTSARDAHYVTDISVMNIFKGW